ncbi:MAG: LysR family transcriptional regulator [Clostridia bacterium]|nr:LysR family transcriptional regulator [Clostridia bacterium]
MDIDKYRVLLKVVELNGLTRAAEELGYTQSSISYILSSIEEAFGLKLLIRERSGIHLTSEGEKLLPLIREICEKENALINELSDIHGLESGLIRIGTFASTSAHWLPGIIKSFSRQYKNIDFKLYHATFYSDIEQWISSGIVDCGFLSLPTQLPLKSYFLTGDRFMAILPKDHPLAASDIYPIMRFKEDAYVQLEDGKDMETSQFFKEWGIEPNIKYTLVDDYAIIAMVEAGLGVALMPELVVLNTSRQVVIKPIDRKCVRNIGLAVRSEAFESKAVKHFVEHVKAYVSGLSFKG